MSVGSAGIATILPGFSIYGTLCRAESGHEFRRVSDAEPIRRAIYAFAVAEAVMYVGSADDVGARLGSYLRRLRDGSSARPVHVELKRALEVGQVDVWARAIEPATVECQGLPVDLLLGAEMGLIRTIGPPWNRRGRRYEVEITAS